MLPVSGPNFLSIKMYSATCEWPKFYVNKDVFSSVLFLLVWYNKIGWSIVYIEGRIIRFYSILAQVYHIDLIRSWLCFSDLDLNSKDIKVREMSSLWQKVLISTDWQILISIQYQATFSPQVKHHCIWHFAGGLMAARFYMMTGRSAWKQNWDIRRSDDEIKLTLTSCSR